MTRTLIFALSLLAIGACSDDVAPLPSDAGTGTDAAADTARDALASDAGADSDDDADDGTAGDAAADAEPDAGPASVTFTLTNGNPGGLSRWVQIVDGRGSASWWNIMPAGALDEFLRAHSSCTLCSCDDRACTPCEPEPTTLELAPGESVTATWDGLLFEVDAEDFCETPAENAQTQFQVEFVWSPEPPDENGVLPAGTLSRTRLDFTLGEDAEVTYELEALAD